MPCWLGSSIRCFVETGSMCHYNKVSEGGRVTARCLAFDLLPAASLAMCKSLTCSSRCFKDVCSLSGLVVINYCFVLCEQINNNSIPYLARTMKCIDRVVNTYGVYPNTQTEECDQPTPAAHSTSLINSLSPDQLFYFLLGQTHMRYAHKTQRCKTAAAE